ncbi:hypothetical protein BM607_009315 [Shewanella sp. SACH]|uniref:hypothetical protein n=1 Tax=Shewanella sp. SACH TaxID=1873135 RepID=UPI0009041644|nr:hypothetical protein [Shewanella sp. SACH]OUS51446.1 hypothetical protein BM607_009315 [Shewanella sp. SACH]
MRKINKEFFIRLERAIQLYEDDKSLTIVSIANQNNISVQSLKKHIKIRGLAVDKTKLSQGKLEEGIQYYLDGMSISAAASKARISGQRLKKSLYEKNIQVDDFVENDDNLNKAIELYMNNNISISISGAAKEFGISVTGLRNALIRLGFVRERVKITNQVTDKSIAYNLKKIAMFRFIESVLMVHGVIRRAHIQRAFMVESATASKVIANFKKASPSAIKMSRDAKYGGGNINVRSINFEPMFLQSSPHEFLAAVELMAGQQIIEITQIIS